MSEQRRTSRSHRVLGAVVRDAIRVRRARPLDRQRRRPIELELGGRIGHRAQRADALVGADRVLLQHDVDEKIVARLACLRVCCFDFRLCLFWLFDERLFG